VKADGKQVAVYKQMSRGPSNKVKPQRL